MGKSRFFAPAGTDAFDYGDVKTEKYVDESRLWIVESSRQFLINEGLWDKEDGFVKALTGLDTLFQVEEAYLGNREYAARMNKAFNGNPNIYFSVMQQIAGDILERKGYPGAKWLSEDDLTPEQYQIWDESILRDKP